MPASTRCLCGFLLLAPEDRVGQDVACTRCGLSQKLPEQFEFPCEACRKAVRTGVNTVGMRTRCPSCTRTLFVPEPGAGRTCPFCRSDLSGARQRCRTCGETLIRPPRLGGLAALLGDGRTVSWIRLVRTDRIDPNPFQPRARVDPEALRKLAQSVARLGILVPLLLRPAGRRFQLVGGSRRLQAARRLGLARVPAVVRPLSDRAACEIAYLENVQREDLDPLEKAVGFQNIVLDQSEAPQEELARRLGFTQEEVRAMLGMLQMPLSLRRGFFAGRLSLRQVRALGELARRGGDAGAGQAALQRAVQAVLEASLTEEETESLVRQILEPGNGS